MSSFKYLISLDLEATCWPGKYTNQENAEIIEIGAVLVNVCSGTIEDQFHSYVRPTRCPKLSDFCVNLTGITQTLVDRHETFSSVYRNFIAWIDRMKSEKGLRFASPTELRAADNGPNATFCSWSNWDLEHFFRIECQRAAIDIPSLFKTWVDVRMMFDQKYGRSKTKFADALKRANVDTVGSSHSGISDATNLGKLVVHLINGGVQCNVATGRYF